jgi:hypothetical protein
MCRAIPSRDWSADMHIIKQALPLKSRGACVMTMLYIFMRLNHAHDCAQPTWDSNKRVLTLFSASAGQGLNQSMVQQLMRDGYCRQQLHAMFVNSHEGYHCQKLSRVQSLTRRRTATSMYDCHNKGTACTLSMRIHEHTQGRAMPTCWAAAVHGGEI